MRIKDLSKYRNSWLGAAMIWIVLYHTELKSGIKLLDFIKQIGYGGVDICLFASGLGCWYSLDKDNDPFRFLKRRISRLAPDWLAFILLWLIFKAFTEGISFQMALGNITALQYFADSGSAFNWYISALLLMYLLAPYFKKVIDEAGPRKIIAVIAALTICTIPFWKAQSLIIIVTRIPIFFMGMVLGRLCKEDREIGKTQIAAVLSLMMIGFMGLAFCAKFFSNYMWAAGLYWYPFILITPGLVILTVWCVDRIRRINCLTWLDKYLSFIGKYSFEIYLVHSAIFPGLKKYIHSSARAWLLMILLLHPLCMCFKLYSKTLLKVAEKLYRRACGAKNI